MGATVNPKFKFGTEVQILALTSASPQWTDLAFYYPSDKAYFYQVQNGVMKKIGTEATGDQFLDGGRADEIYQLNDVINVGGA
jgi:hypothetical protein